MPISYQISWSVHFEKAIEKLVTAKNLQEFKPMQFQLLNEIGAEPAKYINIYATAPWRKH